MIVFFFFSSRRRHTRWPRDWSSDVCSSDLSRNGGRAFARNHNPRQVKRIGRGHGDRFLHGTQAGFPQGCYRLRDRELLPAKAAEETAPTHASPSLEPAKHTLQLAPTGYGGLP